ncbi:MAG: hypothetical protein QOE70_1745 [Chthoniobacter sp.]|jgi:hypothetical protein|nr:hypothetical protein [Chthoniobacter sp.]
MKALLAPWFAVFVISAAALGQTPDAGVAPVAPVTRVPAATQPPDGFTMINGLLYESRNGLFVPVTREMTLRISPNGVVTGFDGRAYTIPPGVLLTVEARGVPFNGTPLAAAASTAPAATANGTPLNPPQDPAPSTSITIYTDPPVDLYPVGTTTFVPNTVFVPSVVTVPSGVVTVPRIPPLIARPATAPQTAPPTRNNRPVTNNPNYGVAPSAYGVNTTATGNQQNTLGTQQIRPGMGNAVGTGGGPRLR